MQSVSVIIPTKNRPDELMNTLRTLFHQTMLPQQLVIVDQSESLESRNRFDAIWAEAPIKVLEQVEVVFIRDATIDSSSAARNRAMQVTTRDIWLFLDDDVDLEPEFIEEILKVYETCPAAGGVSGVITNYPRPDFKFCLWSKIFLRGPFRDERQPIYWNAERLRHAPPIPVTKFGGGLMSFRAEFLRGLAFDETLRGVSMGEDVDFCQQVRRKAPLLMTPRARLRHLQSSTGRTRDRVAEAAKGSHFLYRKHWNHGLLNRVSFVWLSVGYWTLAGWASVRSFSLRPLRSLASATDPWRGSGRVAQAPLLLPNRQD